MPKIKKELTPLHLRCTFGACPQVHLLDDGNILIIGKKPDSDLAHEVGSKVAADENVVIISPEFLAKILPQ
jgi:hypothetical protein